MNIAAARFLFRVGNAHSTDCLRWGLSGGEHLNPIALLKTVARVPVILAPKWRN